MSGLKRFLMLLIIVTFMGCPYGRHMKKGDDYYASGQYEQALSEYEAAQKVDPDSKEAAQKILETKEKLVGNYTETAKTHLANANYLGAIDETRKAYEKLPENPTVTQLIVDVTAGVTQKTGELTAAEDYAAALKLAETLATLPPQKESADQMALQIRTTWAGKLAGQADAAEKAGHKGEAMLLFAKAADLTNDPTHGGKRDSLRTELLAANRHDVVTSGSNNAYNQAVVSLLLGKGQGTTLRIHPLGADIDNAKASLKLSVRKPVLDRKKSTRSETVRYQSGTKQVENPFWKSKQDKVLNEEKRLVQYENDLSKAQSDVQRYQAAVDKEGPSPNTSTGAEQSLSRAKSSVESARRRIEDQRNQVIRAKEEAAREPQTKEEPVYSDHTFTITKHTIQAKLTVTGGVKDLVYKKPAIAINVAPSTSASDETHPAQSIANVAEDPLNLPSDEQMRSKLYAEAAAIVGNKIFENFERWRSAMLEQAKTAATDSERVDAYVVYILTEPSRVDPSVAADISALRGIPDPVRLLTPPQ